VADVLLVGSRTLTVERYGSLVPGGREAWPPIATLSRAGDLDLDRILRARTPPDLIVYGPVEPPDSRAEWRESPADFAHVVTDLRARGARTIVCEGGPTVYAHVLPLATDFSLTLAPMLVGDGPALLPATRSRRLHTQDVAAVGDHVFVHYAF
jgi:riboflavin biosynthesis pyrimidine reductase